MIIFWSPSKIWDLQWKSGGFQIKSAGLKEDLWSPIKIWGSATKIWGLNEKLRVSNENLGLNTPNARFMPFRSRVLGLILDFNKAENEHYTLMLGFKGEKVLEFPTVLFDFLFLFK